MQDRITLVKGDITTAKGIIVHGCNAQGVMGSGVALAIRKKFPSAYRVYRQAHQKGALHLGSVTSMSAEDADVIVVNGITQELYGNDGQLYTNYKAVESVFEEVNTLQHITGYVVNFPLIGCGLGGGDWNVVKKIILNTQHPDTQLKLWVL